MLSDQRPLPAGQEPGELGELRRKLVTFLQTSKHYLPERLLAHFPFDSTSRRVCLCVWLSKIYGTRTVMYIYIQLRPENYATFVAIGLLMLKISQCRRHENNNYTTNDTG